MSTLQNDQLLLVGTTCGSLLSELKIIWDEVGEHDAERDRVLYEIDQECLEVYRRKVDQANQSKAQLRQAIADSETELATICSLMGERPVHSRQFENAGSLKEELRAINQQLEDMHKRKCDRKNQFVEVLEHIQKISNEIYTPTECNPPKTDLDESDLSLYKLEELHRHLQTLHKEKSDRLTQVLGHLNTLNSLCSVLGMDFKHTIREVHPSLDDSEGGKNISNDTIERLASAIHKLRDVKIQRMQKLQDLASTMLELWHLMDTPLEEQQMFQSVACNIAASEYEITEPNTLSMDFINYVEVEVSRLEELKESKMKELVLKKKSELEEICRRTHMVVEADNSLECAIEAIESGVVDPAYVLEQVELRVATVKEEAFSRKEILEKVEKWIAACEEECWLEEYNRDENRYAGRGAHLILKRAEKARAAVNKLPALVEALASKTRAWEKERGTEFLYDSVPLMSMLEEDSISRQEKEQERRRQRDQKKLQGQLIAGPEAPFVSKLSPSKPQSPRKVTPSSTGGASSRRSALGGATPQSPRPGSSPHTTKPTAPRSAKKSDREVESLMTRRPFSPLSYAVSSKTNATNIFEDINEPQNGALRKTLSFNNTQMASPLKAISIADEENRTPKAMPIPGPTSLATISAPQTATTLAPSSPQSPSSPITVLFEATKAEEMPKDIEYSVEERRAGFVLTNVH